MPQYFDPSTVSTWQGQHAVAVVGNADLPSRLCATLFCHHGVASKADYEEFRLRYMDGPMRADPPPDCHERPTWPLMGVAWPMPISARMRKLAPHVFATNNDCDIDALSFSSPSNVSRGAGDDVRLALISTPGNVDWSKHAATAPLAVARTALVVVDALQGVDGFAFAALEEIRDRDDAMHALILIDVDGLLEGFAAGGFKVRRREDEKKGDTSERSLPGHDVARLNLAAEQLTAVVANIRETLTATSSTSQSNDRDNAQPLANEEWCDYLLILSTYPDAEATPPFDAAAAHAAHLRHSRSFTFLRDSGSWESWLVASVPREVLPPLLAPCVAHYCARARKVPSPVDGSIAFGSARGGWAVSADCIADTVLQKQDRSLSQRRRAAESTNETTNCAAASDETAHGSSQQHSSKSKQIESHSRGEDVAASTRAAMAVLRRCWSNTTAFNFATNKWRLNRASHDPIRDQEQLAESDVVNGLAYSLLRPMFCLHNAALRCDGALCDRMISPFRPNIDTSPRTDGSVDGDDQVSERDSSSIDPNSQAPLQELFDSGGSARWRSSTGLRRAWPIDAWISSQLPPLNNHCTTLDAAPHRRLSPSAAVLRAYNQQVPGARSSSPSSAVVVAASPLLRPARPTTLVMPGRVLSQSLRVGQVLQWDPPPPPPATGSSSNEVLTSRPSAPPASNAYLYVVIALELLGRFSVEEALGGSVVKLHLRAR